MFSSKGKTDLLSIAEQSTTLSVPDNLTIETNNKFIILDTVGSQNEIKIDYEKRKEIKTLKKEEKIEKIKEITRDKLMTENFLQDFAVCSSHIVIAVVGQLTFQEQKFLNRIKEFSKRKNLFIIHNLMFLEKKDQVETYIKDTIEASLFFKLEKQSMINLGNKKNEKDDELRYIYVEEIGDDEKKIKNHIFHLIMAREGTEAGNYYNQITINFLRDNIIAIPKQSKFDVIEKFKKFLCLNASQYSQYFDVPNISDNQLERGQIINSKNIECDGNTFKLHVDFDLKLKKCFIDDIGLISYKELMRTPPFSYYKTNDKFIIQIEYCGKLEHYTVKKYISNGHYKFNITGKIKQSKYYSQILFSNIDDGDFILSFDVPLEYMVIKSNEYKEENDERNGILNIIYELGYQGSNENEENLGDDSKFIIDDDIW